MDAKPKDNGTLEVWGMTIDIWRHFERTLNFTSTFVPSIDGAWGIKLADGTFNGMIGMLERREVDGAVSSLGLLKTRAEVADYIGPFERMQYLHLLTINSLWILLL